MKDRRLYWKRSFENSSVHFDEDHEIAQWSKHGLERRVSVFKDLFHRITLSASQTVLLDAGCGPGTYSGMLAREGYSVAAIDYSENMIKRARFAGTSSEPRTGTLMHAVSGIEHLPFKSQVLDFVLCFGVFQHVEDPEPVLREFHRVLKPSSFCMINTLNKKFMLKRDTERLVYYDPFKFLDLCIGVGFKCEVNRPLVLLPKPFQFLERVDEVKCLQDHLWALAHDLVVVLRR